MLDNNTRARLGRQPLSVVEICAGAGGQSIGLERAGFSHVAAIEIDRDACKTLQANRPGWNIIEGDVRALSGAPYKGVDLLAGGVPCPPFSIAGKQLGGDDERDLFPQALRLIDELSPRAVMLENVKGFASKRFAAYRRELMSRLDNAGYDATARILNASDFGVPQLRPRFILVAVRRSTARREFVWPAHVRRSVTVGATLLDLMAARGWPSAAKWASAAQTIAPTIVGGSKKHGGPDLGPSRARADWMGLGVDGRGIADDAPGEDFDPCGAPRLTTRMVARLQGFPDEWVFIGRKTSAYRQVGNAFPPPVAEAVATAIAAALNGTATLLPEPSQARIPLLAGAGTR
jgi:DNA (cytosine-5)-methyltransferase 1